MKKRILSLLLSLVMVVGLLPVTAQAANVNMNTYPGNRITQIVIKASVDPAKVSNPADNYTESRNFVVGEPVVNVKFMFEVESLNYKTSTGGTGTMTNNFPIDISVGPYYYDANSTKNPWGSVISHQMPNYLAGQYCYDVSAHVETEKLNDYRIDPNVKVTINWSGSDKAEDCTENFWACNEDDRSLVIAKTVPFTITGEGPLKLVAAGFIPSGYANEAIKSFSVAAWASGGTKPYKFYKEDGPAGIIVDENGTVHGAPTAVAAATKLKIKVTDSTEGTPQEKTIEIDVGAVKAARTVINTIKIAGLSYPRVDDVVPKSPSVYVTEINNGAVSLENSPICLAMRFWKDDDGDVIYNALVDAPNEIHIFKNGEKYVFNMQVRLEGEETCGKYRLAENLQVIVPSFTGGAEGHNTLTKTPRTSLIEEADYAYLSVSSPEWEAVDTGKTLTGTVSYSGAARYGQKLTANVTDLPEGVSESRDLSYQWQYKAENGIWYDIYHNDTGKSITLNDALGVDKLVGRDIRVTVRCTGTNYAGTLFGAPVTVQKNWNMAIPVKPEIEYDAVSSKLTITNDSWKGDVETNPQEYAWTTSLTRDETTGYAVWPTSNQGTEQSLSSVIAGQTYYVYTRVKGSKTMEVGRIISAVAYTVPTTAIPPATGGIYATDMIYPAYGEDGENGKYTPTIYLEKGKSIKVEYQLNPNNANLNLPQWKETYTATDSTGALVSVTNDPTTKTLTITAGDKTGTVYVVAYKEETFVNRWSYGGTADTNAGRQITVKIYDPSDLSTVPFPYLSVDMGDVEMYVGDTYTVALDKMKEALVLPDGVDKDGYTFSAYVETSGAVSTAGQPPVGTTAEDGSVTIANNVITAEKAGSATVHVFALKTGDSETINTGSPGHYAYFNVTVKARPTVLDLSITPPVLTLQAGKTYQLVATKTLADADAAASGITWKSNNSAVTMTPDANDSSKATVKVSTGAGAGTAIITATYGTGETALTANCIITVTAACGDNHAYVLYQEQDWGHKKVCLFCGEDEKKEDGKIKVEPHDLYESTEEPNVLLCSYCDYSAKLTADTTDETVTPSSPSGGHHGGAGRPYRPGLSTAAPGGTTTAAVQSPKTGDAGIMLYAALSLMSMTGGAWLVSKKRRDR